LGAGHPKYDNDPTAPVRPEQGLLLMRKIRLFANVRPTFTFPSLIDSPLKRERIEGTDFFLRELTGGIYLEKKEEKTRKQL
jgi:3-isopropylmalate dehydrogenase